jgi:TusA-related sulfurtransferase
MLERGRPSDGPYLHSPQAMLDAGGAVDAALSGPIRRRLRDLAAGQILEVVSREPTARLAIPAWCRLTGHELVREVHQGEEALFWIRKRHTTDGARREMP